jgi:hypothetical protein
VEKHGRTRIDRENNPKGVLSKADPSLPVDRQNEIMAFQKGDPPWNQGV